MRRLLLCCALGTVLLQIGCIFPYPAPTRHKTRRLSKQNFDFAFITPGLTTKAEVEEKLSQLSSGANTPGMFWGRFATSNKGVGVVIGGPGAAMGDVSRVWTDRNILVTYDENGVVRESRMIAENKIDITFIEWLARHPRELKLPLRIAAHHRHNWKSLGVGTLILGSDNIRFVEESCIGADDKPCTDDFTFTSSDLVRIKSIEAGADAPEAIRRQLTFGRGKSKIVLETDAAFTGDELLNLLSFARDHCPNMLL